MGIFKKGPLQSPRQARKTFSKIVKDEIDDKRAQDELARRRQQRGGGKR